MIKKRTSQLPYWLKQTHRESEEILKLKKMLKNMNLHTVCQSAKCPNIVECFKKPTATFMLLGNVCTRNCRYCGISQGKPEKIDPQEPENVARAVQKLKLKHVVITSVTRDDLSDGGASQFARTVEFIHNLMSKTTVEVLIPDFKGSKNDLKTVLDSKVDILNHNVETVPALYSKIRPEADFQRSIKLLRMVKDIDPDLITKSGLMVGLGESEKQIDDVFIELNAVNCDALTIGQYLNPSRSHYPVIRYVKPAEFDKYKENAERIGIKWVYSGPFIRSSFNAEKLFDKCR